MRQAAKIERLARDAWPAEETAGYGDWLLRAHRGVTRRANSVWTSAAEPDGWEPVVAEFYGSRGLPVRLQVGDASPPGLDERLAAAGCPAEARTSVLTAPCWQATGRDPRPVAWPEGTRVVVEPAVTGEWLDTYLALEGAEGRRAAYEAIFRRLRGTYATMLDRERPVAVVLGTETGGWLGISCLVTAASHRGRGIGGGLVRTLLQRQPRSNAWLQVADDNAAALGLYGALGFTRAYGYHYRTLPAPR